MAFTCILTKQSDCLEVEDDSARIGLQKIPNGQQVRVVITTPRNIKHHRLLFVLLDEVLAAQPEPHFFQTTEDLLEEIKMGMGYFKMIMRPDGKMYSRTRSIDFATLDQVAFRDWWEAVLKFIFEKILPLTAEKDRKNFEQHLCDLVKEPGPDQLERQGKTVGDKNANKTP